jgi:hypothetical protein
MSLESPADGPDGAAGWGSVADVGRFVGSILAGNDKFPFYNNIVISA